MPSAQRRCWRLPHAAFRRWIRSRRSHRRRNRRVAVASEFHLHGDEIHSRPLPVDYGAGVTVYYGSNDGTLRAVDASSGAERWAFIAPEFYTPAPVLPPGTPTGFSRLMNDSPIISYPSMPSGITLTPVPKDYYFDGS